MKVDGKKKGEQMEDIENNKNICTNRKRGDKKKKVNEQTKKAKLKRKANKKSYKKTLTKKKNN